MAMDNLWDSFFSYDEDASSFFCRENKDEYSYEVNLAGFKKENIDVGLDKNILSVKAKQDGKNKIHRIFTIPKGSNPSLTSASYEDGVLTVSIQKKETAKPVKVHIT